MNIMKLALVLLSVVALSSAVPQNYSSHFQIFQDTTTDLTPSSTDEAIYVDGADSASNSTDVDDPVTNSTKGANTATNFTDGDSSTKYDSAYSNDGTTFSSDDATFTRGENDVTSGSTYFSNSTTFSTGDEASDTDDATSVTDATTEVTNGTTDATDKNTVFKVSDGINGSVSQIYLKSSAETASDGTSSSTHSTERATSPTNDATASTDRSTFSRDDGAFLADAVPDIADGASYSADEVTEASVGIAAHSDVFSELVEPTTEVVSETSTAEANDRYTEAPFRNVGEIQTTKDLPIGHDASEDQDNSTKIEGDEVEEPGFGFTFTLPSFFTTILGTVPEIESSGSNTSSSVISSNVQSSGASDTFSFSQIFNGGLTIDSTPPQTLFNSSTDSTTTTLSPFAAVSGSFNKSEPQNNFLSFSSFDPSSSHQSSSGHNNLSTSDFSSQETPLQSEHLNRKKKSLSESEMRKNQRTFDYSSIDLAPDYYDPESVYDGRDIIDTYDYSYAPHSYPSVRTPEVYTGNSGSATGLFQYVIRTSNLPSVLASFPPTSSSSSTGSHSGVGHVSLASQPPSHSSLLPALQNQSNLNFTSNSLGGISLAGHHQPNTESESGTKGTGGSSFSKHNETSNASETQNFTTTEITTVPEKDKHPLSTRIRDSSKNVTISSPATESHSFYSFEATTTSSNNAKVVSATAHGIFRDETPEQEVATDRPIRIF